MFRSTLSQNAQAALALLGRSNCLPAKTYLAGGSALALHYGYRISVDFDFFTPTAFKGKKVMESLQSIGMFVFQEAAEKNTLLGLFNSVKFSLFLYEYPVLFTPLLFDGISVLDPRDIAAMKIAAVMDRGTKKDFIDLFFLIKKEVPLEAMFKYYDKKYKSFANNLYSIITSLSYFDDAEKTDMPKMIAKISWDEVKKFFQEETIRLAKKYLYD